MRGQLLGVVGIALVQAPIATAGTGNSETLTEVFFPSDGADLDPIDHMQLDAIAARATVARRVIIDGYADHHGTAPHNVGLALRRAAATRDYLISRGVDRDSIVLITYGEAGSRRATSAQDRRVDVSLSDAPLYVIVDRAFPLATAMMWGQPATTAEIEGPTEESPLDSIATR